MNFRITVLLLLFVINIQAQESYEIRRLKVNTNFSDFGVSFYKDNQVVFASAMGRSKGEERWKGNNQPYLNLYMGKLTLEKEISEVTPISKEINSRYHESNAVFTKDRKTVYFSGNHNLHKASKRNLIKLYRASIADNGEWINISQLPFNKESYQAGHPTLNRAEDKLFFISDIPGTLGKTDIYVVDIFPDGSFGEPINLGPTVNTSEREMFPYIDPISGKMYYSSDGLENNIGGLDIYVVPLNADGVASSTPIRLKEPVNSYWDDFSFIVKPGESWGYFSSNRGSTSDDIYLFRTANEDPVGNDKEKKCEHAPIIFDPIYFDTDKFEIRTDAAIALEKIIKVLKKHPELKLKIEAHTDSRGKDNPNMELSENRARSTVAWLIDRGIKATRLESSGFGEKQTLNKCKNNVSCSEVGHQINRRVDFVVN